MFLKLGTNWDVLSIGRIYLLIMTLSGTPIVAAVTSQMQDCMYDFQLMISIGNFCYYQFFEVDRTFGLDDNNYVEMYLYEDEIECFGTKQDDWIR